MLPAALGVLAAGVAAGCGMLKLVLRRVRMRVRVGLKDMANAWLCGA